MPLRSRIAVVLVVVAGVAAACSGGDDESSGVTLTGSTSAVDRVDETSTTLPERSYAGTEPAPEFPDGLEWINVERPLSLAELRGKVVLLDFWTYGCINCIHILPDLERLEEEFEEELVVIGVHSAKFDNEGQTENLRQVVVRYGIEHPVVNDHEFQVWRRWGAQAWPTLVLVDPAGNVVGGSSGEGVYELYRPVIESLVAEFDARIDREPLQLDLERERMPESVLSFPGKVLVDPAGDRVYIADTNHHRIVVADAETGEVLDVAGTGTPGLRDGPFTEARFDRPQGLALSEDGTVLYVADVGNHSVRFLDFSTRSVGVEAGTGAQSQSYPPEPGPGPEVALSSPWALERSGDVLYVAMAGSHQLWSIDLGTGETRAVAGSGREGTTDGPSADAELAQPSGLAMVGDRLFFADSESSTIRYLDVAEERTGLLAGSGAGLFDFGDVDGVRTEVRLQHPLGVTWDGTALFVADTYNDAIKRIDPETGETVTFAGGEAGWRDGPDPLFYEPGGLDVADGVLYVADTNNHSIRKVDLTTGEASTLVLYGIERFVAAEDGYTGRVVTLERIDVAAGAGTVVLDIGLPEGYKVNDIAPFSMAWSADGGVADLVDADRSILAPEFPLEVDARFTEGEGTLTADLTVYYCTAETEELCLIERVRIEAPLRVGEGSSTVVLRHDIPLPVTLG